MANDWRSRHGGARRRLLPLLVFSTLIVSGCVSTLPVPPQPTVTVTTTRTTTYYSLHGTTPSKIFEEIEARGLVEQGGKYAAGLAEAKSEMTWQALATGAVCTPQSVTIMLDLVVTLPRHERPDALSKDLRERWQHFAAAVAAHEQRHVDIFLNGANAAKMHIEAALKKWASCTDLETRIPSLWKGQQAETEKAQRQFDVEDRARIDKDRKPLQTAIDTRKAQLAGVTAKIRQLDVTLDDLRRQSSALREDIDTVTVEITKANGGCSRPTGRVQALCRQYNELAASHNALIAEHSSVVTHRNRLTDEHNALVEAINELVEALNWVI